MIFCIKINKNNLDVVKFYANVGVDDYIDKSSV